MTATCPPELEERLLEQLSVQNCVVIRAATPRPEISYNVRIFDDEASAETSLVESVKNAQGLYRPGEKGLVFCRGHRATERLASRLSCPSYHRDGRTVDELRKIYDGFLEDNDESVMVATSLLGAGVDIPHVRHVWHFGVPWSLIDYVQETGRGGRDGRPAHSHVFTWKPELVRPPANMHYTEEAMRQLVVQTSGCRRELIGHILDHRPTSCALLRRANLCDHCHADSEGGRPLSPIQYFRVPSSVAPIEDPHPHRSERARPSSPASDPEPRPPTPDPAPPSPASDPGPSSRQIPAPKSKTPDPEPAANQSHQTTDGGPATPLEAGSHEAESKGSAAKVLTGYFNTLLYERYSRARPKPRA